MSKVSIKWAMAIAAVVTLMLPASALPASSQPCANISISLTPPVVARGDAVTIAASIGNCSSARQLYTIRYEITTPCTSAIVFSIPIILRANQTLSASVPVRIPSFFCPGNYTVTVKILSRTTLLSSSSATLTVL